MNHSEDDLEALFEAIAAERQSGPLSADPATPAASGVEPPATPTGDADAVDSTMYDRLGMIVRQLHDSLRELGMDRSLREVVDQVSDSQTRLQYIADLTEQAANKVLNAVDVALPVQEAHHDRMQALNARWNDMLAGRLDLEAFKALVHDSQAGIQQSVMDSDLTKARLMDIMMAQDFQDISGQVIKKVVALTERLEHQLANLLRDYAPPEKRTGRSEQEAAEHTEESLKNGPSLPGSAMVQDEVDSLLADLGF